MVRGALLYETQRRGENVFRHWKTDIQAVLDRDPAARSALEVILCYPSFRAVRRHRLAHWLWTHDMKLLARIVSQRTRRKTGIEIHPGAEIGEGLFIDHGMGVIIGETAQIGNNVTLYQGVTLGGTGKDTGKRHPTICDNVVIGSGAKVLGPFTVGEGSKIGAGSIVLKEVPPNCTVVGNPGRVVRRDDKRVEIDLDQVNLPDPVKERILALTARVAGLERSLSCATCEKNKSCPNRNQKEEVYADEDL
ncbi:MAG: serine O-acetyltransferase [Clostridia bacterium]|nr:serine O-acetyltransferase [Clostridia bacterium]